MIALILTGFVSGIISGMGIGGGTVLIPVLTVLMGVEQKQAQAVNLVYFVPTALMALINHGKNGRIEKNVLLKIIVPGALGAILGAFIAMNVNSGMLRRCFGYFLAVMGALEVYKGIKHQK